MSTSSAQAPARSPSFGALVDAAAGITTAYQLRAGAGPDGLHLASVPRGPLEDHDVRVAIRAAALNYRDLVFARGQYGEAPDRALVPLSDGAGLVTEVGAAVTRFGPGDRVITTFFPGWLDGAGSIAETAVSYGAQIDGALAEELVAHEDGLVRAPASVSDAGAAAISCAGVTAWNALFVEGAARPGATVLILGTGGVAIWALQLAHAAGLHPIITSSSDEKLARAEALGARGLVNYRRTPEWQEEVLRMTGGRGAELVLEVGGEGTLARSIVAARYGGRVIVIGGLTGFSGTHVAPGDLIGGKKTLSGIMVGSRRMTEDLVRFIDVHAIQPVVDREFAFADARAAYEYLGAGRAFGKAVINVG